MISNKRVCSVCNLIELEKPKKYCPECKIIKYNARIKTYLGRYKEYQKKYQRRLHPKRRIPKQLKIEFPKNRPKWTVEYRKEYCRKYYKEYFKNKPSQKIAVIFRQRLWRLMKGVPVAYNIEELIGCKREFFLIYLENNFLEGMNWGNHTKDGWHIDHITPCCKFDLTNPEELKKCFHYTNLQPLWAVDNLRKGGK